MAMDGHTMDGGRPRARGEAVVMHAAEDATHLGRGSRPGRSGGKRLFAIEFAEMALS